MEQRNRNLKYYHVFTKGQIRSFIVALLVLSMGFNSCSSEPENTPNESVKYPYTFLSVQKEIRELDGKANVMRLYVAKPPVNFDSLKLFCLQEKRNWEDGVVNLVVFFDNEKNAVFPPNITGGYVEASTLKHVMAEYQYMSFNGWRKLTCYEKNEYESVANQIDLRDN